MTDKMPRGRKEVATLEDVIEAARSIEEDAFGNNEVAERLPIGPERTRARLNELVEQGVLHSKRIGNANVYWFEGY